MSKNKKQDALLMSVLTILAIGSLAGDISNMSSDIDSLASILKKHGIR